LYLVIHFRRNVDLQSSERVDPMKISARNQIQGTITDVTKGATTSHVRLDVGGGAIITASITNESVDEMKLEKGQKAVAVIKATDVMIGVD
jgi:molybdopterin-binding protein